MTDTISQHRSTLRTGHPLPDWVQLTLCVMLMMCGVISATALGEFSPLPMTWLLDAWILLFLATAIPRTTTGVRVVIAMISAYALSRVGMALLGGAALEDVLQAYRWLLYLVAFCAAVSVRWTQRQWLVRLTWVLVLLATVKAGLTLVVLGPDERPGLFIENNFELALFSGLTAVMYDSAGRSRLLLVGVLGLLVVLSGSRSGAVVYLLLMIYAIIRADLRDGFLRFISAAVPLVIAIVPVMIFRERSAESQVIDRVRFLDFFLQETAHWPGWQWLVGAPPLTPLSANTCTELAYYEALFSASQDGTCYSVILHAYLMRVVFDAGVFGALLAFMVPLVALRRAGTPWLLVVTLVGIALANSLSVSGLNNPYVALPIVLAIMRAGTEPPPSASLLVNAPAPRTLTPGVVQ